MVKTFSKLLWLNRNALRIYNTIVERFIRLLLIDFSSTLGDNVPSLEEKISTPVFHCHGEDDDMKSMERGHKTSKALTELVKDYQFHTFPNMGHEANQDEMDLLQSFIQKHLPDFITPVDSL